MRIGDFKLTGQVLLAPMAGVSDRPCRQISVRYGAALATTEMLISDRRHWRSTKSQTRLNFDHNPGLVSVQIAGNDPAQMADAARALVERGADMIDINFGCPAKKVCGAAAGSALLRDLPRVRSILDAVIAAVPVPVTVKTRTGWDDDHRTAIEFAQMAEAAGAQAMTLHGRTRAQHFNGRAEHDTLKRVRDVTQMTLIANGDINTPELATDILSSTGADGVMIGRAAQGNPWLIQRCHALLTGQKAPSAPPAAEQRQVMLEHLSALHDFYGEFQGVRFARKHLRCYWET
ncbi:MAG: tRNA dihydrouridine synthase DusB, partial [Litorivicinus sp.]